MSEPTYTCPECGSDRVTTAHIQTFMVNTGEHYCHSIKTNDSNSPARCIRCDWTGVRQNLVAADSQVARKCAGCGAANCDCDAHDCRMGD